MVKSEDLGQCAMTSFHLDNKIKKVDSING